MNAVRDETITQCEHELGSGLSKADSNLSAEVVARKSVLGTFRKRSAGHAVGMGGIPEISRIPPSAKTPF
ncbi:MAG: hypothetical protein RLZZ282_904 [Verrucomicrobiota bacterium]|jgi:hypothetical protein